MKGNRLALVGVVDLGDGCRSIQNQLSARRLQSRLRTRSDGREGGELTGTGTPSLSNLANASEITSRSCSSSLLELTICLAEASTVGYGSMSAQAKVDSGEMGVECWMTQRAEDSQIRPRLSLTTRHCATR